MTWVFVVVVPVAFSLLVWQIIAWIDELLDWRSEEKAARRYQAEWQVPSEWVDQLAEIRRLPAVYDQERVT